MINLCIFASQNGTCIYKVDDADFLAIAGSDVCCDKQADIAYYIADNYNLHSLGESNFNIIVVEFENVAHKLFDNLKETKYLSVLSAKMFFSILLKGKIDESIDYCTLCLKDKYFGIKINDGKVVECNCFEKTGEKAVMLAKKDFEQLFENGIDFSNIEQERKKYDELEKKYNKLQNDWDNIEWYEIEEIEDDEGEDDKSDLRHYAWALDYLTWSDNDNKNYYVYLSESIDNGSMVKKGDTILKLKHRGTERGRKVIKAERDGRVLLYVKHDDKIEKNMKKDKLLFIVGNEMDKKGDLSEEIKAQEKWRNG